MCSNPMCKDHPGEVKPIECDHIVAFHLGHDYIVKSELKEKPKVLEDDCCGGVMILAYCPVCGAKNEQSSDK